MYSAVDSDASPSASPRVEVVSGLVYTANNFVPSRRFREDRGEASKLATGGRRQNTYSWHTRRGGTNEAWSPSAGLSGARGAYLLQKRNHSDLGGHPFNVQAKKKNVCDLSWPDQNTDHGVCF